MGECSKGMSGKARIPQAHLGAFVALWGSLTQCMAVPSSGKRLCQRQPSRSRKGKTTTHLPPLESFGLLRNTKQAWTSFEQQSKLFKKGVSAGSLLVRC